MAMNQDNFVMSDLTTAFNAGDGADLVNALKIRLHFDMLEGLTPNVRKRVDILREIQSHHDEIEANFFDERAALEVKYQKLYQPLYTKRYEVVNGEVEVSNAKTEGDKEEKGVPGFWFAALKNNEVTGEEISESDEEPLKFLKDIKWSRTNNHKGFKLEFFFNTNTYFKNSVLTKTYHMIDDDGHEPILKEAIGTEIEWYPGKCLTPKIGLENTKPITKTEQCESFFNFFSPPVIPEDDEELDEDDFEELENLMEEDYDIGSTIRDKIIPHAVSWFTGEALEDEYDSQDDDDSDDYDDDIEEDEDDDEEEEDGKTKINV